MVKIVWGLLIFLIYGVSSATATDDESLNRWDESTPAYAFFSNGIIRECPSCDTLVVIASSKKISPQLIQQFKKLAQRVGNDRTNQGVLMRRDQLLSAVNELTQLRCNLPDHGEENVAYFIDRRDQRCVKMPYSDEETLRVTLERIYGYLDDRQQVIAQLNQVNDARLLDEFIEQGKKFIGSTAPYISQILQLAIELAKHGA